MSTEVEKYQSVIITLDDGRTGVFTGRVFVELADEGKNRITGIKFTEPRVLPDGCSFEELESEVRADVKP